MIRVPEDKKVEIAVPFQMFEETGLLVCEDEVWLGVVEEQYNRIKASYDSGKFKQMNDDESLSDLCELLADEARKAKWQQFRFDYPEDVVDGFTFEEMTKAQWDAEAFNEMVDAVLTGFTDEELEEINSVAEAAYEDVDRFDEIGDEVDELNDWMRKNGFEYGETFYYWRDENNNTDGDFDIAWPYGVYGLQRGFTKPVAVKLDATEEQINAAEDFGYTLFTSIEEFKVFIEKNYGKKC